jgi:hypothetical protein
VWVANQIAGKNPPTANDIANPSRLTPGKPHSFFTVMVKIDVIYFVAVIQEIFFFNFDQSLLHPICDPSFQSFFGGAGV